MTWINDWLTFQLHIEVMSVIDILKELDQDEAINDIGIDDLGAELLILIVDPQFSRASPLDRRDSLFICEKLILKKVGVATYFIFILKGK